MRNYCLVLLMLHTHEHTLSDTGVLSSLLGPRLGRQLASNFAPGGRFQDTMWSVLLVHLLIVLCTSSRRSLPGNIRSSIQNTLCTMTSGHYPPCIHITSLQLLMIMFFLMDICIPRILSYHLPTQGLIPTALSSSPNLLHDLNPCFPSVNQPGRVYLSPPPQRVYSVRLFQPVNLIIGTFRHQV